MPELRLPLVSDDDFLRREVQRTKRAEWSAFRATLDRETLDVVAPNIRRSESAAVAALNYLEDHELAEVAHMAIHRVAFMRRGLFGCPIVLRDDDEFWTDCSVDISHLRAGMSAGLTGDFECSICAQMVEDCDHTVGEVYDKVVSRDDDGKCSVCESFDCEHRVGKAYPSVANAIARNMILEEGSIVARPRYPLARMIEKSIDLGSLGDDPRIRTAARNASLNCDGCLGPCSGFNDMLTWNDRRKTARKTSEDDYDIDMVVTRSDLYAGG
ncbi:hypothetical protein [Arthrobacter sp. ISL-95]|uniref:hypothetical protein n=1 Tax=Arthrobacter sp. ISL-95 TaxID=2819116 RepID=UPI001BEB5E06|nr:hypothetical protein [Arthrobacter sp. ISL-95]MBT2585379.1 hypothetical protein [Arthrobacter sp. ISL-95]